MVELDDPQRDPDLRESIEGLCLALSLTRADPTLGPGDIPSGEETRELLSLYAKLPSEDIRRAVLALLRAIVGSTP